MRHVTVNLNMRAIHCCVLYHPSQQKWPRKFEQFFKWKLWVLPPTEN